MTLATQKNESLNLLFEKVFLRCNIDITSIELEQESLEYSACTFCINDYKIVFRNAKVTPTKVGQFVTIWKRNKAGITEPFNISDTFSFFIIVTRSKTQAGFFIFPKTVLVNNGIISGNLSAGKRGIRVYPSWDITTSKQAQQTQKWQSNYFINFSEEQESILLKTKALIGLV